MPFDPALPVWLEVDEVSRRSGQSGPGRIRRRQAAELSRLPSAGSSSAPGREPLVAAATAECALQRSTRLCSASPFRMKSTPLSQIFAGMIGGIGAVRDDRDSRAASDRGKSHASFAHARQAHLGDEVEVVLVDDNDLRAMLSSAFTKAWRRALQASCRTQRRKYLRR